MPRHNSVNYLRGRHIGVHSWTAVAGLAAFSPVTPPQSPSPPNTKVRSKTCNGSIQCYDVYCRNDVVQKHVQKWTYKGFAESLTANLFADHS